MKKTRQATRTVKGEKVLIKARGSANGSKIRYSVDVNGQNFRIGIPIIEIDTTDINFEYISLGKAMDKGFAKWLVANS